MFRIMKALDDKMWLLFLGVFIALSFSRVFGFRLAMLLSSARLQPSTLIAPFTRSWPGGALAAGGKPVGAVITGAD
jgi:hypothetical protein